MILLPDAPMATAGDVVEMLRRHYLPDGRPAGGIFAGEIESPDGRRRADALWCPWSIAGGSGLVGHEVKVSRSDVLAELADPMKSEPWARYCTYWWLVVASPSLVDGLDVPEAWGVMSPPSGRKRRQMTVLREAPRLKPADTGPGWRRVASWQHFRLNSRIDSVAYEAQRAKGDADRYRDELHRTQLAGEGRAHPEAVAIAKILEGIKHRSWLGSLRDDDVDRIVTAIVDLDESRALAQRARDEVRYLADRARELASPMDRIGRELERLAKAEVPA